jgi:hypothetical protein
MTSLVQLYVEEVKAGRLTIDEVPPRLRPKVEKALEEATAESDGPK